MNNQYFNNLMDGDSWLRVQTRLRAGIRVLTNKKNEVQSRCKKDCKAPVVSLFEHCCSINVLKALY